MDQRPPRIRRARPLADAPIDELLVRAEDLAKGWLLALLERAPLQDAQAITASAVAADGPRICAAVLSALASDRDLARLEEGGMLESLAGAAGTFGGRGEVQTALGAVEALHRVLWSALRAELRDPEPEFVFALAERLAAVTELVRAAALRSPPEDVAVRGTPLRAAQGHSAPAAVVPEPSPAPGRDPPAAGGPDPRAAAGPDPRAAAGPDPRAVAEPIPRSEPADPPANGAGSGGDEALWVAALEDEIVRSRRTGAPLSLLLAELADSSRLVAAERAERSAAAFGRFAQAVRGVLRRQDLLASEDAARAWVIARDTGRAGAAALADRIAAAVAAIEPMHGAPLAVSVGIAVLDEDAPDAASLLAASEEACFTAAATGTAIAGSGIAGGAGEER